MLEFWESGVLSEKKTRTTKVRHGEKLAEMISEAAISLGVEKSVFLRAVIARGAARVLEEKSKHVLSSEDAKRFSKALNTPPPPTELSIKAKKAYQIRIDRAD